MKRTLVPTLLISSLVLMVLSLTLGPSKIGLSDTIQILLGNGRRANQAYIILQLRLPRILGSFFCGAALGVAGAVFQASLHNSMADPFILGISSGASFGVALALF